MRKIVCINHRSYNHLKGNQSQARVFVLGSKILLTKKMLTSVTFETSDPLA